MWIAIRIQVSSIYRNFKRFFIYYCNSYRKSRTKHANRRRRFELAECSLPITTTSRRCYRSCIGFRFDAGWSSRSPLWSTCHCPVWPQPIWPPTVSWSPTKVAVSCVLPHRGRVLSDGPTAAMETGVLRLQVLDFGTAFQLICDKLTLALNNLNGY